MTQIVTSHEVAQMAKLLRKCLGCGCVLIVVIDGERRATAGAAIATDGATLPHMIPIILRRVADHMPLTETQRRDE